MRRKLEPYLVIGKKKHPWGKPIEMFFDNLRIGVHAGYMTQVGTDAKGKFGFGKSTVDDVTLFFQTKEESGWLRLDVKEARKLKESLDEIFDEDKKGFVKKTFASHPITKYQRYKDAS